MRLLTLSCLVVACSAPQPPPELPPPPPPVKFVAPKPLRRMSDVQYLNALADLFPDVHVTVPVLPREAIVSGLENDANAQAPSDVRIARYDEIARLYGDAYDTTKFPGLDALGERLFRRPLSTEEHDRFAAGYAHWAAELDDDAAVRLTLEAMLQSPQFLYRVDESRAAWLAFFLWESVPTDGDTDAALMLKDPRSRRLEWSFHRQWLGLDRIVRDEFEPDLQVRAIAETRALVEQAHGFDDVMQVFTRTAWLAGNSHRSVTSPPMRGNAIQSRLLCLPPVSPPPGADLSPPMASEGVTNRQRFESRTQPAMCQGCHQSLNGIGFGFEHYASDGTWQDVDNGEPVDARGVLYGTDVDGAFDGADALVAKLAHSRDVRRCAAQRWLQYALGRPTLEGEADLVEQLSNASDLDALLLAITEAER